MSRTYSSQTKDRITPIMAPFQHNGNHSENLNASILYVVTDNQQHKFSLEQFQNIESVGVQPDSQEDTLYLNHLRRYIILHYILSRVLLDH